MILRHAAISALPLVALSSAWAAQPLVTDDAAVLPSKACQLEAWITATHSGNVYSAQPACNIGRDVELSVGAGRDESDSDTGSSIIQIQAKAVLLPRGESIWSFGMTAGVARDTAAPRGRSAFQTYYAKGLASWYPRDDLEIDFNVGAANAYEGRTFALAGAAVQYAIRTNVQALAEIFHDEPGPLKYQLGARYIVAPGRFEAYVSYGNTFGRASHASWVVAGIRIQSSGLLP